jgi:hypothetical protein
MMRKRAYKSPDADPEVLPIFSTTEGLGHAAHISKLLKGLNACLYTSFSLVCRFSHSHKLQSASMIASTTA